MLSMAAASFNLSGSPAMLITRQGGRVGDALAVAHCQRRVHRGGQPNRKIETQLEWPGGGPGESPRKHAARQDASADSGISMKLADVIERYSQETSSGAVFAGTSVPIKLLFEFLEDDQTVDTFLDQFPTVSRDQARAVLSASRDMLLSAAGSET